MEGTYSKLSEVQKNKEPKGLLSDFLDFPDRDLKDEALKYTRALIQSFLQTIKAFRLYDAHHPILSKFLERLRKDFANYFERFDTFPLLVGEFRLFFKGQVVYENRDIKDSLAFFFFKDGIREIRFFKGLEFREIIDFLNIVRRSESVNRLEDDLVTLLWERDFSHITFGIVDEFLEGGHFHIATMEDLEGELEYKGVKENWQIGMVNEGEEESPSLEIGNLRQALNPSPDQTLLEACQLSNEELEEINREVQQEQQLEHIFILIEDLIEILLHLGDDMDAYENMIIYFERIIESLLEHKEIKSVVEISMKLEETIETIVLKDKQIFAIRRILETLSAPRSIALLGEAMKAESQENNAIYRYLRLLTHKAIDPLFDLLGNLDSGKWRREICDIILELSRKDITPLIKYLSHSNDFIVLHALYIIGNIGEPSVVKYLDQMVTHEDPKIRDEILQLLKKFGEAGKELLRKFLNDPLPEIRAKAALIFARISREDAFKPLTDIILSNDFFKRDYEEKASFFKALGETGSKEVITFLKKILGKRRWLQKGKWDEMRLCAMNTLRMMGAGNQPAYSKGKERLETTSFGIH